MSIRLGIIGLGAMGAELLDVAAGHPDFNVVTAADIDQATVERVRLNYPNVAFTGLPDEVIESSSIDALYIATPPKFHADYSIRAMRAGKHVFCEKPLAISLTDGESMLAAAREYGVVNAVNFALADRNAFLEIERAYNAGEIGEVRGVDIRFLFPKWPRDFQADALWLDSREQGGFIREVFSHFAYITDRLFGSLTAEYIDIEFTNPGSESRVDALLRAGGIPVHVCGKTNVAAPEIYEWYIIGSRRSYCLRNWGELLVSDGGEWGAVELTGERGTEYTRLTAFANAIRGAGQTNLADFASAYRVQKIIEAFHLTASTSRDDLVSESVVA